MLSEIKKIKVIFHENDIHVLLLSSGWAAWCFSLNSVDVTLCMQGTYWNNEKGGLTYDGNEHKQ